MLTIRLTRKGKKNQPFFRIVVIDKKRSARGGRAVEELGYVNPLIKKHSLEKERILYWISKGAKPSPRIHNLLVSEKIIDAKKINVFKVKKNKDVAVAPATDALVSVEVFAPKASIAPKVKASASMQDSGPLRQSSSEASETKPEVPAPGPA